MKLINRLIGRGDPGRGREMLDDVEELFRERRAARGGLYAWARRVWDVSALIVRRQPPPPLDDAKVAPGGRVHRLSMDGVAAWKAVRNRPLVSLGVVASLGLGLGLTMLTFTIVDGILLRPLAFPRAHELLLIYTTFGPQSGYNIARSALSGPEVAEYAAQNHTVDVAAYQGDGIAFADGSSDVTRVQAARVSSGLFRILETPPALGRTLVASEDALNAPCAAVLSHGLWLERFAGDRAAVGRIVRVNGEPCEVVGVMPERFTFPTEATRIWLPLSVPVDPDSRGNHGFIAVGRLRPGVDLRQAHDERAGLMARWAGEMAHHKGHEVVIAPLRDELVWRVEPQLLVLAAAVALVLLTIAANMSSLLLAHGEARRRELALRSVLGASRLSLVRQLLIEGWLLALLGGVVGGALAWWSLDALLAAYPGVLPRANDVEFALRTAAVGLMVSLAIGTLVSAAPAIRLTRGGSDALRAGERGSTAPALRVQRALVISELAIGMAVTVGALLLVQSFVRLQLVPLGFDPLNVTTGTVGLPLGPDRGADRTRQFYAELRATLEAQPGVEAAGAISSLPIANSPPPDLFTIEGRKVARPSEPGYIGGYVMVTPGVFDALRIDILRGRAIADTDTAGVPAVAVINEALARLYWPGEDPIGRRIRYPEAVENGEWSEWGPWITIVGLCRDVRALGPTQPPRPAIYVAHAQLPRSGYDGRSMAVVVRADPASHPEVTLRRVVRALDPDASVSAPRPMETIAGGAVAMPRFMGWIMTVFAVIAVTVAAVGVYSVVAYGVMLRRREIGVRLALGASRAGIIRLVGRQTLTMTIGGMLAGLGGAALLAWTMSSVLFDVNPYAVPVYSGVVLILATAIVLATIVPARRAMRVDPLIALKTDL